jgi:Flp pilus assembly protein TadD
MGLAYYGLGKFKEAIKSCKQAIEIKPDNDKAYHNMGLFYVIE